MRAWGESRSRNRTSSAQSSGWIISSGGIPLHSAIGVSPKDLGDLDRVVRSTANRIGVSLIVVGLLVSSSLMARVNDAVALAGFALSAVIALYVLWKILRTPGEI